MSKNKDEKPLTYQQKIYGKGMRDGRKAGFELGKKTGEIIGHEKGRQEGMKTVLDTIFNNQPKKNSGCFITTATCQSRNLPDDCHELTVLRHFRDNYMKNNNEMNAEIEEYYEIAPIICQNIENEPNSQEIYENIYEKWLKSAVLAVDNGENEQAHDIYKDMVLSLKKEFYK